MSNVYTFQYTDFLNDSISTEKFVDELTVSGLEYINMDSSGVYMYFDHELSPGDYTSLSGTVIAHDGVPYPEEFIIKTGSASQGSALVAGASGESEYHNINNYRFMFMNPSADKPYTETSNVSWVSLGVFMFCGSTCTPISKFASILAGGNDSPNYGKVRLYDLTNNKELCVITSTEMTTSPGVHMTENLYNLPSSPAMVDIQYKRVSGGGIRMYYVLIT